MGLQFSICIEDWMGLSFNSEAIAMLGILAQGAAKIPAEKFKRPRAEAVCTDLSPEGRAAESMGFFEL